MLAILDFLVGDFRKAVHEPIRPFFFRVHDKTHSYFLPVYKEHPLDCLDLLLSGGTTSGIYTVDPDGMDPIKVYCDQETFGGGWTVLLRRIDSTLDFTDKVWKDYKNGFGVLGNNFWLGNDYIHRLTKVNQRTVV